MPHNRAPRPGSMWYLPENTYRLAESFCYTYFEMKDALRDLDGRHSPAMDGMPRGSGTSDPTQREAMKRAELERKIEIIEKSVLETSVIYYKWLMAGVTIRGMSYVKLRDLKGFPCGKNKYSRLRREVYYRVAERL